jgi:enhancing lycopene biosynthesis protein 2
MKNKKFAVILSGCGVYDGAEIHESVLTLLAIDSSGSTYECFAPDIKQYHVIDHSNGSEMNESRNVFIESARIARGNIMRLKDFNPDDFDAVVLPGGFGVAKNLCTYAIDGPDFLVNPLVEQAIDKARKANLPIGAMCIAPVLISQIVQGASLTIGNDSDTVKAIETLGAKHVKTQGDEVIIDKKNKIVTTPCYMLNSPITTIAKGTQNLIDALYSLM